jgi:hypothetical protein
VKPWVRLIAITMTVGGGFAGAAASIQSVSTTSTFNLLATVVFTGLYVFACAAGLLYVHNPQCTGPLVAALALQVPSVSSSLIVYKFTCAVSAFVILGSPEQENAFGVYGGGEAFLGSTWRFGLGHDHPLRIGTNVVALVVLLLLLNMVRSASNTMEPTNQESVATYSSTQTP